MLNKKIHVLLYRGDRVGVIGVAVGVERNDDDEVSSVLLAPTSAAVDGTVKLSFAEVRANGGRVIEPDSIRTN